jgi:hypothetical protein
MTRRSDCKTASPFSTRPRIVTALILAAVTGAACQTSPAPRPTVDAAARWSQDSANYVRDSIKWVHDSVVVDSISRTVNTDSLYRLNRAQLRAEDPIPLQRAIGCEMSRLYWVYGPNAAGDAYHRMLDTLYRPVDRADMTRVSNRLHSLSIEEMASLGSGPGQCGGFGRRHPPRVDDASLDGRTGRPARPVRPGR